MRKENSNLLGLQPDPMKKINVSVTPRRRGKDVQHYRPYARVSTTKLCHHPYGSDEVFRAAGLLRADSAPLGKYPGWGVLATPPHLQTCPASIFTCVHGSATLPPAQGPGGKASSHSLTPHEWVTMS